MAETIVWSKDNCPFCDQAKSWLTSKGITYEERNLSTDDWHRDQLLELVPDAKTVPQIFLYGEYVGGWDKLQAYAEEHDMWRDD